MIEDDCEVCCDDVESFHELIEANISKSGRTVINTTDEDDRPFAYSVGHAERQLPELIATGLNPEAALYLVNTIGDMMFAAAEKGEHLTGEVDLGHIKVRLADVTGVEHTHACQALYRQQRRDAIMYGVTQIIWPDADGRYPGEDGYDQRFKQRLLNVTEPPTLQ